VEDGTFPALLKTLSDPSEAVVTRDLLLLSQISKNSDDSYFTSFMVNLLNQVFDAEPIHNRHNIVSSSRCRSPDGDLLQPKTRMITSSSSRRLLQ
jgi:hypothetical protein